MPEIPLFVLSNQDWARRPLIAAMSDRPLPTVWNIRYENP